MANNAANVQMVRNPPPRMLTAAETLYSLNHWKTSFRTYYRRDSYYKGFLLPEVTWNARADNFGQTDDVVNGTVVRSALDKGEDLKDFLHTLVGYLPFPYLTEKVVNGSSNLEQVWDLLYEHYGLKVTGETMLDFMSLSQLPGESPRQYFDRLMSHARLHLTPPNLTVDGIESGAAGETMTISLMNFIAMHWLHKLSPSLINIVRVEYNKDLREGVQLAQLVPRLANSIEALLSKNNVVGAVDSVSVESQLDKPVSVNKVKSKQVREKKNVPFKSPYCPECKYLAKKLNLEVNFSHYPSDCPRPKSAVNLLLADVQDSQEEDPVCSEGFDFSGKKESMFSCSNIRSLQKKSKEVVYTKDTVGKPVVYPNYLSDAQISTKVLSSTFFSDKIRKESSPQLRLALHNVHLLATVDEGSELNCICSSYAAR